MPTKTYDDLRAEAVHFWPPGFPIELKYDPAALVEVKCEKLLADDSLDHLEPRGTAQDNTHWTPFVARCEAYFGFRDLRYLDLGCAGGGLVFDFAVRRHFAIGLEGSDYSLLRKRAEWASIPKNLYTGDMTRWFRIVERATGAPMLFDVIGIWDALEHLEAERLPTFFDNVSTHLAADGLLCGTVSTRAARTSPSGGNHHATVRPRSWWEAEFAAHGFVSTPTSVFKFEEFPRGNGIVFPADFSVRPDDGFHFTLVKRAAAPTA
jgi:SAM-dependent methyltransferase